MFNYSVNWRWEMRNVEPGVDYVDTETEKEEE